MRRISKRGKAPKVLKNELPWWIRKISELEYEIYENGEWNKIKMTKCSFEEFFGFTTDNGENND